jgi:serine/threonine-protein kinase RsbW
MPSDTFPGRYDQLEIISQFIEEAAADSGLSDLAVYAVQSAVDEACTNIIDHAYGGQNRGTISCTAQIEKKGLRIILKDTGKPFIPQNFNPKKMPTSLENVPVGGLGLHFIYNLMDEVHFESDPKTGNTLTMFKRKE